MEMLIYYNKNSGKVYNEYGSELFTPLSFFVSQNVHFKVQFILNELTVTTSGVTFTPDTYVNTLTELEGSVAVDDNYLQFIQGNVTAYDSTTKKLSVKTSNYIITGDTGSVRIDGVLYPYTSYAYKDSVYSFILSSNPSVTPTTDSSVDIFEQLLFKTTTLDFTDKSNGAVSFESDIISSRLLAEMNSKSLSYIDATLQMKINSGNKTVLIIPVPIRINNIVDYQSTYIPASFTPENFTDVNMGYDSTLPITIVYHDIRSGFNYGSDFVQLKNNSLNIFFTQKFNLKTILIDGEPTYNYSTSSWDYTPYASLTEATTFAILSCNDSYGNIASGNVYEDSPSGSTSIQVKFTEDALLEDTGKLNIKNVNINYTSYSSTDGVYTFYTEPLVTGFTAGDTVTVTKALLLKTAINSTNNDGHSNGVFITTINAVSKSLISKLTSTNYSSISGHLQVAIYVSGNVMIDAFDIPVTIENVIDVASSFKTPIAPPLGSTDYTNVTSVDGLTLKLYYDVEGERWFDSKGDYLPNNIIGYFGAVYDFQIQYTKGSVTKTSGGVSFTPYTDFTGNDITTSFVVSNVSSNSFSGYVSEECASGTNILKVKSSSSFYIEPSGSIRLLLSNVMVSFTYSSYTFTSGTYTFTLDSNVTSLIPMNTTVVLPQSLLAKSSGSLTSVLSSSTGLFTGKLYIVSNKLIEAMFSGGEYTLSGFLQHTVFKNGVAISVIQVPYIVKNRIDNNSIFNVPELVPSFPNSTTTPVEPIAGNTFYYDVITGDMYDADGYLMGNRDIVAYVGSVETFSIQYVVGRVTVQADGTKNFTAYTDLTGRTVASSVSVNNTVTQKSTGSVFSVSSDKKTLYIVFSNSSDLYVAQKGKLRIYDSLASSYVDVSYSSYVINLQGVYVFKLDTALSPEMNITSDSKIEYFEEVMARAVGTSVDDSRYATGAFKFSLKMMSAKLSAMFSEGSIGSVSSTLQHAIYSNGTIVKVFDFPVIIKGLVDYGIDYEDVIESDSATKTWTLSLLRNSLEFQYSSDNIEWHSTQETADVYFRSRLSNVDAVWSTGVQLPQSVGGSGGKIFNNESGTSGYDRAVFYAVQDGISGEVLSVQHSDGQWFVYQIKDDKSLQIVSWYITSKTFTLDDLDSSGYLWISTEYYPTAIKGNGVVVGVVPSLEDTLNNLYRLNLKGMVNGGVTYKLILFRE